MDNTNIILSVENLCVRFKAMKSHYFEKQRYVHAVDDVSFVLPKGKSVGLVGESGSGKTTIARAIVNLLEPYSGDIKFLNKSIYSLSDNSYLDYRKKVQFIFQDPYSSLNPRKHIYEILSQPMLYHGVSTRETVEKDMVRILDMVGLARNVLGRYPHEFSGGQRQRIGIARALSLNPRFIVCDEPVSALDVSIQAQILNLLKSLQKELHLTLLFVGHGLGAVNYVSDRIAVMYLGKIVEMGEAKEVFNHPVHPYTKALLDAVPVPDPKERQKEKKLLQGEIGDSNHPPKGCRFHPRCPYAVEGCGQKEPELWETEEDKAHCVACPIVTIQSDNSAAGPGCYKEEQGIG